MQDVKAAVAGYAAGNNTYIDVMTSPVFNRVNSAPSMHASMSLYVYVFLSVFVSLCVNTHT